MSGNKNLPKSLLPVLGLVFGTGLGILASALWRFSIAPGMIAGSAAGLIAGLVFQNLSAGKRNGAGLMKRKPLRRIGILLCVFVLAAGTAAVSWTVWFDPYRGTVDAFVQSKPLDAVLMREEAAEDLNYIVKMVMERHPACMDGLADAVSAAYEREAVALAARENVTVQALWQSAGRVLHELNDAHTAVRARYDAVSHLSLAFSYDGAELVCRGGEYDGFVVTKIGGAPVSGLYERFRGQSSYELEQYAWHSFANRIGRSDDLAFAGAEALPMIEVEMKNPGTGERIKRTFSLQETETAAADVQEPFVSCTIDDASGIGVLILHQCDYNETYKAALKEFFTAVKAKGIQSVILDLRDNPGGNSLVGREFIRYLPVERYQTGSTDVRFGPFLYHNSAQTAKNNREADLVFDGGVYVLTSTASFSSAVDFAVVLSDNGICTVVGEIPGNMPSSYGDILKFQTPNAKLAFTVSYKYFIRPDASKSAMLLIPDVQVSSGEAMAEAERLIAQSH